MLDEIKRLFLAPLLRVDIREVIADSMRSHDSDIVALNQQQLQAGELSTGSEIKPFYKPITVRIKKAKGQPADRVTLKDKGNFYKGMRTQTKGNGETEVSSTDPKTGDLVDKYSVDIFGLSVASLAQLGERMRPTAQDYFKRALR